MLATKHLCYFDFNQRKAKSPKHIQINKYMYHTSSSIKIPWMKEWLQYLWQKWRIKAFSAKYLYFSQWLSLKVRLIFFIALKHSIKKFRSCLCNNYIHVKKFCPILVQLQIPQAYIVQNTTGCLFISLSKSITDNCSLWILFNKEPLCILADLHKPVPSVDINQNYKGENSVFSNRILQLSNHLFHDGHPTFWCRSLCCKTVQISGRIHHKQYIACNWNVILSIIQIVKLQYVLNMYFRKL